MLTEVAAKAQLDLLTTSLEGNLWLSYSDLVGGSDLTCVFLRS